MIRRYRDSKTPDAPDFEKLMQWLEDNMPPDTDRPSIIHNDYKFDNVVLNEADPLQIIGVLDWEMAVFGPRELDVAWLIFFHKYFQYIALNFGFPEAPMMGYMRREDIVANYERLSGTKLQNINWYLGFSLMRMAMFDIRINKRSIHFGERTPEDDPNNYLFGREIIRKILKGEDPWNF